MFSIGLLHLIASSLVGANVLDEDLKKQLAEKLYPNNQEIPNFVSLPSSPHIAVAHNDTALLKVSDLRISHYPLKMGRVTFYLGQLLTEEIPEGSSIDLVSFVGDELLYNGTLPVCDYLAFANMHCPVKADSGMRTSRHVLQVPEHAGNGRLTFKAVVTNPKSELIIHAAGIVDLENDGTYAEEPEGRPTHDEL